MLSPLRGYTLIVAWCVLLCLLASPTPTFAQNTTIDSFNHAKKLLPQVFAGHETEFYCGCTLCFRQACVKLDFQWPTVIIKRT